MTASAHQQNGQRCGSEYGIHGTQKPLTIGTTVRSTCQRWFGRFAVTTLPELSVSSAVGTAVSDVGFSGSRLSILPTVVTARCSPARARCCAIFALPIVGHSVLSRC